MIGFNSNRAGEEQNNVPPQSNSSNTDPIPNLPPQLVIRYGECLKNHAANVGRHVTDGCGEFMPSGEEPLKCAACDCHRSFHRREVEGGAEPPSANIATAPYYPYNFAHRATIGHLVQHPPPPPPPPAPTNATPQQRYGHDARTPVMMAFGGGAAAQSSSEEMEMLRMNHDGGGQSASRKRFRTKFTPEQKARMREFAERIEWKIQKQNEAEVQQFCAEVGVKRQVFKVWMHNCNQASKRKQS